MQVVTVMVDEKEAEDDNVLYMNVVEEQFYYDADWLGIVMESQQYLSTSATSLYTIPDSFEVPEKTKEKIQEIQEKSNFVLYFLFIHSQSAHSIRFCRNRSCL